ncbi:hypothetical protein BLNAU_7111 [Blattamonas nauphoetae]|uniref:Uncharacterized protein n=1 Tax=Blattamonas nauphoetae TaxID=2049346 RepID=A0ABQ9Y2I9_9EUKA|nr:hypothetical protein BLNAU_7111 [Blattamonas nauphoetae]
MKMKQQTLLPLPMLGVLERNSLTAIQFRLFVLTIFVRVKCIVTMFDGKRQKKMRSGREEARRLRETLGKKLTERKRRFFGLAWCCGKLRLVLFHSLSRME